MDVDPDPGERKNAENAESFKNRFKFKSWIIYNKL